MGNFEDRVMKDEEINNMVKERLAEELDVEALDIRVNTLDGEVHLDGIVDVYADRSKAEEATYSIDGVMGVENRLAVAQDNPSSDKDISGRVMNKLYEDRSLTSVGVVTDHGILHLKGTVETLDQQSKAIKKVEDEDIDDSSIINEINRSLINNGVNTADVEVTIDQKHNVVVNGSVNNMEDRARVRELISEVKGVVDIDNRLTTHQGWD